MNFVKREDAKTADNIIQELIIMSQKGHNSIGYKDLTKHFSITEHHLKAILETIRSYQRIHHLEILGMSGDPSSIDMGNDTNGFYRNGGFLKLWDDLYEVTEQKRKVDRVNESVRITNKTVIITSIVSGIAAVVTVVVSIMAYNKTNEVIVKELQQLPSMMKEMQECLTKIDTLYILSPETTTVPSKKSLHSKKNK